VKFLSALIKKNSKYQSAESDFQYTLYGIFALIGFIGFYFFNPQIIAPGQYENIYIRAIAASLAFLLLVRNYWPKVLLKYIKFYWYIILTFNLPFFFSFMLLQNHWSPEWQMNELMALTILAILTGLTSTLLLAPIGIALSCLCYYLSFGELIPPENIVGLIVSYITILIFCSIYSYQKNKFYVKKLEFYKHVQKLNSELEEKIKERTHELSDALAVKTEFLNNISHEIRTPILGVGTIANELLTRWKSFNEEKRYFYLEQIAKNSNRLTSMLGSVLDLAKSTEGQMILDITNVDLNKIISAMIDESNTLYLQGKNIKFAFTPVKLPRLQADSERISQVVRNLFVNAIKFSHSDSVINIKAELTDENKIKFSISDSGVGIPDDELDSIFLPFTQSSRTKTKAGGTGLGLAISSQIIEAHLGKIWAKNNKEGATFCFEIPIKRNKEAATTAIAKEKERQYSILIIDDEETCLISLELLLSSSNYRITRAEGGVAGLEALKSSQHFDLILLDMMMPDIYGLDFLKYMMKDEQHRHIPVIIQSGIADQDEIDKAIRLGARGYIRKPYQKNILLEIVTRILAGS